MMYNDDVNQVSTLCPHITFFPIKFLSTASPSPMHSKEVHLKPCEVIPWYWFIITGSLLTYQTGSSNEKIPNMTRQAQCYCYYCPCFSANKKWKHHQPSHLHRCLLRHLRHCFRSTLRTALAALVDVGDWLESTRWDHSEDMTSNLVSMKDGKFYFSWSTMYIHI